MAPYRHPLRHALPATWANQDELRRAALSSAVVTAGGTVGVLVGVDWLFLTLWCGLLMAGLPAALLALNAGVDSLRLRRAWGARSELRDVLARRPQAGSEDPELAHELFAVTVEDDGWLLTWRFRPLPIVEGPDDDEIEVPGRPRYAARVVDDRAFAVEDAAQAAEQLVEAQERAAEREAAAAAAAQRAVETASLSEERALEARTTA